MSKKEEKIIRETTKELLELLSIDASFKINVSEEGADVVLETEERGIIIGHHGDVLESLQLILSLCVSKRVKKFIRISLEVGEYKKNREDWLRSLAIDAKDRVIGEKRQVLLPSLKAWERRVIHLMFQNDAQVVTESIGEGKDRTLVVKPRS